MAELLWDWLLTARIAPAPPHTRASAEYYIDTSTPADQEKPPNQLKPLLD
jgi:hypothetical protein